MFLFFSNSWLNRFFFRHGNSNWTLEFQHVCFQLSDPVTLSHRCHTGFVFVCVSTFALPPIQSALGPSEAWENWWWIWTSKLHQLGNNQGPRDKRGKNKKGETFFFSTPILEDGLDVLIFFFWGIGVDRLFGAQWGTFNLPGTEHGQGALRTMALSLFSLSLLSPQLLPGHC